MVVRLFIYKIIINIASSFDEPSESPQDRFHPHHHHHYHCLDLEHTPTRAIELPRVLYHLQLEVSSQLDQILMLSHSRLILDKETMLG